MFMNLGIVAILQSPRTPKSFLLYARSVLDKAKNHPSISYADLADLEADIAALDEAETLAKDKNPVAVADRNAKALRVYWGLGHFRDYVQRLVEKAASPADAIALIVGVGFSVRQTARFAKPPLAAKYGAVSGEVLLVAAAILRGKAYFWEYSLDQIDWTTVPETTQASTTITGLTPARVYYFRFRALTTRGKLDYSPVVSLLMH